MHSEGLTFQPVVENKIEEYESNSQIRDFRSNDKNELTPIDEIDLKSNNENHDARTEHFQDNINYVGEVQQMVLESKNWFFDEAENLESTDNTKKSESSSVDDDEMVTNFGKRIMHTLSPKKKLSCPFL